jgi:transcriptional regulator with XRE-family HTH domain
VLLERLGAEAGRSLTVDGRRILLGYCAEIVLNIVWHERERKREQRRNRLLTMLTIVIMVTALGLLVVSSLRDQKKDTVEFVSVEEVSKHDYQRATCARPRKRDECAKRLGVCKSHLCDVEKGRKTVSPERAAKWARTLGYPESVLVRLAIQGELDAAGLKYKVISLPRGRVVGLRLTRKISASSSTRNEGA